LITLSQGKSALLHDLGFLSLSKLDCVTAKRVWVKEHYIQLANRDNRHRIMREKHVSLEGRGGRVIFVEIATIFTIITIIFVICG